jgi:hypothetical protein
MFLIDSHCSHDRCPGPEFAIKDNINAVVVRTVLLPKRSVTSPESVHQTLMPEWVTQLMVQLLERGEFVSDFSVSAKICAAHSGSASARSNTDSKSNA